MLGPEDILWGGVIPAAILVLLLSAERLIARRGEFTPWPLSAVVWPLLAVGGYLLGHVLQQDNRWLNAVEPQHWLPWIALASGVVGATMLFRPTSKLYVGVPLTIGVVGAFEYLTLNYRFSRWSTTESVIWLGAIGVTLTVVWLMLQVPRPARECEAERPTGIWDRAVALLVVLVGSALVVLMSGTQSFGEMIGTMIFVALAVLTVAKIFKSEQLLPATLGILIAPFGILLVLAHFLASLTLTNLAALLIALLLATAPISGSDQWKLPLRWGLRLVAVGIPIGIALAAAGAKFAEDMANPSPY